jgi:hypothetical protein
MSEFNKERTISFIIKNKDFIKTLKKFANIKATDAEFAQSVIELMKLNISQVQLLTKIFSVVVIPPNTLFCSSTAESNHAGKKIGSVDDFPEMGTNKNQIKGTRWFTSCFTTETSRNLGSIVNLSMSSTFLGLTDDALGRILFYRNNVPLRMIYAGEKSFQQRRLLADIMTKLILGQDYDLEKMDNDFNNYGSSVLCDASFLDKNKDCACGVWSGYGTLPEYVINYLFEDLCYNYDSLGINPNERIYGVIAMDGNYDQLLKFKIFGTEYKVFTAETVMTLEAVLYMGKIYYDVGEYKMDLKFNDDNYKKHGLPIHKDWDQKKWVEHLDHIEKYCQERIKNGSDKNVFTNSTHRIKSIPLMQIGANNKFTYFISSHGVDIGKIYVLPKDVKILMICETGTMCMADDKEEAKLWKACMMDPANESSLKILDKYCVYDGNTLNNRIPDLILSEESHKFFSGIFEAPFSGNVIMTKSRCGFKEKYVKQFGEIKPLDNNYMIKLFDQIIKGEKITDPTSQEFINYFFRPGVQKSETIDKLLFLIAPNPNKYYSFFDILEQTGNTDHCLKKSKVVLEDTYRREPFKIKEMVIHPATIVDDIPTHATDNEKATIRQEIATNEKQVKTPNSLYLSDVINFLCNKNKGSTVTIIVSACRNFPSQRTITLSSPEYKGNTWYDFIGRPQRRGIKVGDYFKQSGGDEFYHKYLKYKTKYNNLKNQRT